MWSTKKSNSQRIACKHFISNTSILFLYFAFTTCASVIKTISTAIPSFLHPETEPSLSKLPSKPTKSFLPLILWFISAFMDPSTSISASKYQNFTTCSSVSPFKTISAPVKASIPTTPYHCVLCLIYLHFPSLTHSPKFCN